jgi:4-hydroxybenzoate polyprenyltransferase
VEQWGLLGLIGASLVCTKEFGIMRMQDSRLAPALGLVCWLAVAVVINLANYKALRQPVPEIVQRAVKTGVLSLVWLDVVAVTTIRGPVAGLTVAALWVPAFLLGKWLYST